MILIVFWLTIGITTILLFNDRVNLTAIMVDALNKKGITIDNKDLIKTILIISSAMLSLIVFILGPFTWVMVLKDR